jgi:hypothetical protein
LGSPRGFDGKAKEKQKLAGEKGLKPTADKTKIKADFFSVFPLTVQGAMFTSVLFWFCCSCLAFAVALNPNNPSFIRG